MAVAISHELVFMDISRVCSEYFWDEDDDALAKMEKLPLEL